MVYFFKKHFNIFNLNTVEYWKCSYCGFTGSKTHFEMPDDEWEKLNHDYHFSFFCTNQNPDDLKWKQRLSHQTEAIKKIYEIELINSHLPGIDYGCGDGLLVNLLSERGINNILKYDKYAIKTHKGYLAEKEIRDKQFNLVINTSVFEHVRDIAPLNEMNNLVSESDGVFAIHTLIREEIPNDPDWFYLLPVHCSLFTNKSMQILFEKWNYQSSVYHLKSRLWFFFKKDTPKVAKAVSILNKGCSEKQYFYKKEFVDYWK